MCLAVPGKILSLHGEDFRSVGARLPNMARSQASQTSVACSPMLRLRGQRNVPGGPRKDPELTRGRFQICRRAASEHGTQSGVTDIRSVLAYAQAERAAQCAWRSQERS